MFCCPPTLVSTDRIQFGKFVAQNLLSHTLVHVLNSPGTVRKWNHAGFEGKRNKTLKSLSLKCMDFSDCVENFVFSLSFFEEISKTMVQRSCFRCKSSEGKLGIEELQRNFNLLDNFPDSLTVLLQTTFFFYFKLTSTKLLIGVTDKSKRWLHTL